MYEIIGLFLTVAVMLIGAGTAYGKLKTMISINSDEIVRTENLIKTECANVEEKIGNLRILRELKTDKVEDNLKELKRHYEETSARFEACRSTCPIRQKKGQEELDSEIESIKRTMHGDDGIPRFVPVPVFEKRCDNFTAAIRDLEKKIDEKDHRVEKMFSDILVELRS